MLKIFRTLLADDHELIRAGLKQSLALIEHIEIIGETGNGRDLFLQLELTHPDLLVVDLNMPDFEPVSDIQKIRLSYPQMKIIVVSAYDDQSYVIGLLTAGVDGYHLKDQPLSDLQMAVRRVTAGGKWISDPLVNRLIEKKPDPFLFNLSRRQRQLLYYLSQGFSNQKIATMMDLSVKTVENHLTALYRAIKVEGRLEASLFAKQHPELILMPAPYNLAPKEIPHPILLVDNNPRFRYQLGKIIARNNPTLSIYEAEDSTEAINISKQTKPIVAFVDVILGEEDGIYCLKRIKEVSPQTKVILISAYPDREFHRLGMDAGAVAFLDKKDIDAAAIHQLLEDLITVE
ncbi:MAG: response regulator transcription factor [Chloroflexota bacterium]